MIRSVRLSGLCALLRLDLLQPYFDRLSGLRGFILCGSLGRVLFELHLLGHLLHFPAVHLLP